MLSQLTVNALIAGSICTLVAVGFSLTYRIGGFFNFAHAAILTLGAFFAYWINIDLGLHWVIAFPLAVFAAAAVGTGIDVLLYEPLRSRKANPESLLLASLGVYVILESAISMLWGTQTRSLGSSIAEDLDFAGARITSVQLWIIVAAGVLVSTIALVLKRTKYGRGLRATADNPDLAALTGIPTRLAIALSFAIGSFLAASAGILISLETFMTPLMGFSMLIGGIAAMVVGGIRNTWGCLIGALLISFAQQLTVWALSARWQDMITFVVIGLFLVFRPQGIIGSGDPRRRIA
jgi:branched-subunit amino acid ABC-type transport system permease component